MIYPDLPFDQAGGDGGVRGVTQMVVIHATDNTASDEAEARYAETRPDHTSAHFYADDDSVIQALDTAHIAYGCYPIGNSRSIQFELSGLSNQISDATMRRAAPIVARVCRDWGIPIEKIGPADLVAGRRGICGHADVTAAWGQGDHTDPGPAFPWPTFISYISQGEDMTPEQERLLREVQAMLYMLYALWDPTKAEYTAAGGLATIYDQIGQGSLVPLLKGLATQSGVTLTDTQVAALGQQLGAALGGKLDRVLARLEAAGKALEA